MLLIHARCMGQYLRQWQPENLARSQRNRVPPYVTYDVPFATPRAAPARSQTAPICRVWLPSPHAQGHRDLRQWRTFDRPRRGGAATDHLCGDIHSASVDTPYDGTVAIYVHNPHRYILTPHEIWERFLSLRCIGLASPWCVYFSQADLHLFLISREYLRGVAIGDIHDAALYIAFQR